MEQDAMNKLSQHQKDCVIQWRYDEGYHFWFETEADDFKPVTTGVIVIQCDFITLWSVRAYIEHSLVTLYLRFYRNFYVWEHFGTRGTIVLLRYVILT